MWFPLEFIRFSVEPFLCPINHMCVRQRNLFGHRAFE
jgi:hypothetical protein